MESFEKGVFRIAPASSYKDPSLNSAQVDKELEHVTVTPNEELMVKLYTTGTAGDEEVPVKKKELFRYMMVPDFYVWCCGLGYDARLFYEFRADAVLVIWDKNAFGTRLADAVTRQLPARAMTDGGLSYYDSYTVRRKQLVPIFSKHFGYLYQNEYRFAWTVPTDSLSSPSSSNSEPCTTLRSSWNSPDTVLRPAAGRWEEAISPATTAGAASNPLPLIASDPRLAQGTRQESDAYVAAMGIWNRKH